MVGKRILRKVKVEGGYLDFNSAHFITYSGKCERLHGHNYEVLVEVEGDLGVDSVVFDFTVLKKRTKEICQHLDHRFLLPLHNPLLKVTRLDDSWEIRFQKKRYLFPLSDVVELPIENSSAELLAQYICEELYHVLSTEYSTKNLSTLMVGVAETPMQMAYYCKEFQSE